MNITDILGQSWNVECMGCAMGASEMIPPGGIIAENESFYMHQDPLVPLEGFLVVASRRHLQSLAELTPEEHADYSSLLRQGREALRLLSGVRSFSVIQEEGSTHFHSWFFPWRDSFVERYGSTSLSHIRPAMEHSMQTLNTPDQRARVLHWVDRLRLAVQSRSQEPGV